MSVFGTMNIAASGLSAQRLRLDVIASNLANAETTRTQDGGPYRRKSVVLQPITDRPTFKSHLVPEAIQQGLGQGVKVVKIAEDKADPRMVRNPSHPDAIVSGPLKGYVMMPNVNPVSEVTDMIKATRAYEANVTVIQNAKRMFQRGLEIGIR